MWSWTEKGYRLCFESPTNQIFVIVEDNALKQLGEKVEYGFWEKYDEDHTVIRIATSWSTKKEAVDELLKIL